MNPNKKRLGRTMMFLNAQKPGLIKDPYIYKPDSIMLIREVALGGTRKMDGGWAGCLHGEGLVTEGANVWGRCSS